MTFIRPLVTEALGAALLAMALVGTGHQNVRLADGNAALVPTFAAAEFAGGNAGRLLVRWLVGDAEQAGK